MSYDSSCSGDSFIDAIEEENGVSRMVIMGLTGLRDSLRGVEWSLKNNGSRQIFGESRNLGVSNWSLEISSS